MDAPRWLARASLLVVLIPLLLAATGPLWSGFTDPPLHGDFALTELSVQYAAKGDQWLGPYSRYGFRHPGPLLFYATAPLYRLTGGASSSLTVVASLVNLLAITSILRALSRLFAGRFAVASAILLGLFLLRLGGEVCTSIWNPYVTILPFVAFLTATAPASCGRWPWLPVAAFWATWCVQSHIGYAPAIAAACVVLIAAAGRHSLQEPASRRIALQAVVATVLLLGLLWLPPLVEQFRADVGNLSKLWTFFTRPADTRSWLEACALAGPALWSIPPTLDPPHPRTGLLLFAAPLVLMLTTRFSRTVRSRPEASILASLAIAFLAVLPLAIRSIRDEMHDYLTLWMSTAGLLCAFALLAAYGPPLAIAALRWNRAAVRACALAVLLGISALNGTHIRLAAAAAFAPTETEAAAQEQAVRIIDFAQKRGARRLLLHQAVPTPWILATRLVLAGTEAGLDPRVDPDWMFMFHPALRWRERPDCILLLRDNRTENTPVWNRAEPVSSNRFFSVHALSPDVSNATLPVEAWQQVALGLRGWTDAETFEDGWLRWGLGPTSSLVLALNPGEARQLVASVRPWVIAGRPQSMTIALNGHPIGTRTLRSEWTWQELTFDLPATAVSNINHLAFQYACHATPDKRSAGSDTRPLAVAFRRIVLGPPAAPDSR